MDWFANIEYLITGNPRQQNAYKVLKALKILERLSQYNPVLSGTIPIEIDIPSSDLDIICQCEDHQEFSLNISSLYGDKKGFQKQTDYYDGIESTVVKFQEESFKIEIFAQNKPVLQQNAYKHMIIEYKILKTKGLAFRDKIIALKKEGYKTEPAFAKLLGLKGDPYKALLKVEI
ncbi:DUF4269 domain-containing protein [uncultured Psychroserpens sp.]|uniref:DUF4269 domain-containing protein n=1 Tax=uncultured Psychroserpens sp. TaxID=255436 RepID=UPI002638C522|nr:DUF4269 domain-containing protein [uncultured Psychroserpens sp.]